MPSKSAMLLVMSPQLHGLHVNCCRLRPASSTGNSRGCVAKARTQNLSSRYRSKFSSNRSAEAPSSSYIPASCALWAQRMHQRTYGRLSTIYSCNKYIVLRYLRVPNLCVCSSSHKAHLHILLASFFPFLSELHLQSTENCKPVPETA